MAQIETVRGPIDLAKLGTTLMHEHNDVIPALKQKGVSDEQVHTMLVENPRKIFERQGAY
jgi:predicted metal-dependent phosphotriesterase family hydrolase